VKPASMRSSCASFMNRNPSCARRPRID
jgi:hypothetical protein